VTSRGKLPPFDVDRLNPEQRRLWDEHFASGTESLPIRVWSFGYWCMLTIDVPDLATEWLAEVDPDNLIRQYQENVRGARRKER
jgi:hypothetical protein